MPLATQQPDTDTFDESLIVRAATIDELLSDDFEPLPGQKSDTDLAARRLAAWCRSCASGDWQQFGRRLHRDGWDFAHVLTRLATVRHRPSAPTPAWVDDARWIDDALHRPDVTTDEQRGPVPFEQLLMPVVDEADARLWSCVDARVGDNLTDAARASLRHSLLTGLCGLCAPALYALFDSARKVNGSARYDQFVTDMKTDGFRRLFDAKPVLLRLIATLTRQWIEATRELIVRLDADLADIRRELVRSGADSPVTAIEGGVGDAHNGGRSVRILVFEGGARIVYKPKDLRVDVAWQALVDRLNRAAPPLELKAVRTLSRDGYGWSEFVDHTACTDRQDFDVYFRRAGAWLALFYCFAAGDMHQENIIAAGAHPVPIDIETILQAAMEGPEVHAPESQAYRAALETIANSVMMVRLIPSYLRAPDYSVFALGGLMSGWNVKPAIRWDDVNADGMRPAKSTETGTTTPNLPHVGGDYARFADHLEAFVSGFETYARFLAGWSADSTKVGLFDGFAGLPVRRVLRPTRFYSMLLQRLKDHRSMGDGVVWSAQADFVARLAEWEKDADPHWPLLQAERKALLTLNVPYFVLPTDGTDIRDATGISAPTQGVSGLERVATRIRTLDAREIDWQVTVIRQNMESFAEEAESPTAPAGSHPASEVNGAAAPTTEMFVAAADNVAAELSGYAIRRGPGAAWIGLDWLGESEVFQLVCLGPGLYAGVTGVAVFLAAHAAVTGSAASGELALAGVAHLRHELGGRNAARVARSMGIGGGTGLGSIIYGLSVMSSCLHDDGLLADAHAAAALMTDDLIAADTQLDAIGGSAGAILGLLRLHRDSPSGDVLTRATRCGEHLLRQPRVGPDGRRTWTGQGSGPHDLNGISHGAAGYAYALAALSEATGRADFAQAASECIAFENDSFDPQQQTWPWLRDDGEKDWPYKWCHGAPGIGLARIAMARLGRPDTELLTSDIRNAVVAVERGWQAQQWDTLCCGTLGSIEFLSEAGTALGRPDLDDLAARRLAHVLAAAERGGEYRWRGGTRRFNPGVFRGLAGVGYTALRRIDGSLPNVLIWE